MRFSDTLRAAALATALATQPTIAQETPQSVENILTTPTSLSHEQVMTSLRSILDTGFGPKGIHLQNVNGQDMIIISGAMIAVDDLAATVQNNDIQGTLRAWIYEAQKNLGGSTRDTSSSSKITLPTDSERLSVSAGPIVGNTAGSGLRFKTVYDSGTWALGSEIISSTGLQSYFLAMGFQITQEVNGMISIASVSQDAAKALGNPEYHGDISAISLSAQVNYRNAFLRFLHEQGKDITLSEKHDILTTVTQDDFTNFIRNTTTTIDRKTTTLWDAFSRNTVLAGYRWDIGESGQLVASVGASNDPVNGTRPVGGADYTYYGGAWKASLGAHAQGKTGILSAAYAGQLDPHWSGEVRVGYVPAQGPARASVLGGVSLEYDSKPASLASEKKFVRPNADGTTPTPATLVREAVDNPTLKPNPTTLGEVKRIVTETHTTSSVDTARPAAPACTADDTTNTINCGSLSPSTLEVSTTSDISGYGAFNTSATYPGNQTVYIRTKASGSTPASMATSLSFSENAAVNNEAPTIADPTLSGAVLMTSTNVWSSRTDVDITISGLTASDPDGLGSYTIVSALFGTLASGTGTLPSSVTIPESSLTGKFGQSDIVTISMPDTGNPARTSTKTITINIDL